MKKITRIIIVLLCVGILGGIYLVYKAINKNPDYIYTRRAVYTKLEDGTLEYFRYTGDDPVVNIPEKVWGRKVTQIGAVCFTWDDTRYPLPEYQVHIPDTVTVIDASAFERCRDLTITGARNIEKIGHSAFAGCSFKTPFPFSDNLKVIDRWAFASAEGIGEISLSEHLEYIGHSAFLRADVESVEIPSNVSYVGECAFEETKWFEAQEGYLTVGQNILIKFPDEETVITPDGVRVVRVCDASGHKSARNIYIRPSVQIIETPIMSLYKVDDVDEIKIYIPTSVDTIKTDFYTENKMVRYGMEKVTFIVEVDSYAEEYAREMSEKYKSRYEVVDKIEYPE
ncbi:MAG: leucine-rich repeat domain-containing protein [Acetatifactor sp.]|nr:leucine-rich repeat domain-containing protein [Acetatifactor sp.]